MSDDTPDGTPPNIGDLNTMWSLRHELKILDDGVAAWLTVVADEFTNHPNLDDDMVTSFLDAAETLDDERWFRDESDDASVDVPWSDEAGHDDADFIRILRCAHLGGHVYVDQHVREPHEIVLTIEGGDSFGVSTVVRRRDTILPPSALAARLAHTVTAWVETDRGGDNTDSSS